MFMNFLPPSAASWDWILIDRLEFDAIIGIYPHEREARQALVIDLRLGVSCLPAAAQAEHIGATVDYQRVCEVVMAVVTAGEFQLLETLAEHVTEQLFAQFPIEAIGFRAIKPHALPYTRGVGVEIMRVRTDSREAPGAKRAS